MRRRLRWYEFVAVIGLLAVLALVLLPVLARSREAKRLASCQNNLKQLGSVCTMYANESRGEKYPNIHHCGGDACDDPEFDFMFQGSELYPEYMNDPTILVCPSQADREQFDALHVGDDTDAAYAPCEFDSASYVYFAWAIPLDVFCTGDPNAMDMSGIDSVASDTLKALIRAVNADTSTDCNTAKALVDVDLSPMAGGKTAFRVREPVFPYTVADPNKEAEKEKARRETPLMLDRIAATFPGAFEFNHAPGAANVLFQDGHVEFIEWPGKWPVTVATAYLFGLN